MLDETGTSGEGDKNQNTEYLNFVISTHESAGSINRLRASLR